MRKYSLISRRASVAAFCLGVAVLAGCAQDRGSTMGGPGDDMTSEEQQRARGSMAPLPPGQNKPGGDPAGLETAP